MFEIGNTTCRRIDQQAAHEDARARFGNQAYRPRDHELSHAASLVSEFGRDAVLRVLPRVSERVKQRAKEDVYFGFAVPYFRKELAAATSGRHVREVAAATRAKTHVDQVRVDDTIQHRQRRHAALLTAWSTTTASERAAIRARALKHAASETARRRILTSNLDQPIHDVLHELELVQRRGVNAA